MSKAIISSISIVGVAANSRENIFVGEAAGFSGYGPRPGSPSDNSGQPSLSNSPTLGSDFRATKGFRSKFPRQQPPKHVAPLGPGLAGTSVNPRNSMAMAPFQISGASVGSPSAASSSAAGPSGAGPSHPMTGNSPPSKLVKGPDGRKQFAVSRLSRVSENHTSGPAGPSSRMSRVSEGPSTVSENQTSVSENQPSAQPGPSSVLNQPSVLNQIVDEMKNGKQPIEGTQNNGKDPKAPLFNRTASFLGRRRSSISLPPLSNPLKRRESVTDTKPIGNLPAHITDPNTWCLKEEGKASDGVTPYLPAGMKSGNLKKLSLKDLQKLSQRMALSLEEYLSNSSTSSKFSTEIAQIFGGKKMEVDSLIESYNYKMNGGKLMNSEKDIESWKLGDAPYTMSYYILENLSVPNLKALKKELEDTVDGVQVDAEGNEVNGNEINGEDETGPNGGNTPVATVGGWPRGARNTKKAFEAADKKRDEIIELIGKKQYDTKKKQGKLCVELKEKDMTTWRSRAPDSLDDDYLESLSHDALKQLMKELTKLKQTWTKQVEKEYLAKNHINRKQTGIAEKKIEDATKNLDKKLQDIEQIIREKYSNKGYGIFTLDGLVPGRARQDKAKILH